MAQPATLTGPPLPPGSSLGPLTLGGIIEDRCALVGDVEALVFDDPLLDGATVRWRYRDLGSEIRRVAKALLASGVQKGDRVAVLMGNRPEAVASLLGAAIVGAVAVPLSTFSAPPELAWVLRHASVSVLLLQSRMGRRRFAADVLEPGDEGPPLVVALGPEEEHAGIRGWERFVADGDAIGDEQLDAVADDVLPTDPCVIVHTSGTTARPKGVIHRHEAIARQWWSQAELFGREPSTRVWCPLPVFWTAGLNTAMGATLAAGATWVQQETFEPGHALRLLQRERVDEPHVFGHQARALEEHPDWTTADLSSCTRVYGKSVFTRHRSVQGDPAWNMPIGYGLSETASFFTGLPCTTPRAVLRNGSYGKLLPGNELRVVDPTTGRSLGPGSLGELIVRGPTLMAGYVGRSPEDTFEAGGWYRTGDLGSYDEDGFVFFTGRLTEMIKTGGANVSPAEIEVELQAFEPVKLARLLGVPDERRDQVAVLCVALKEGATATEDDVTAFLRTRLASYKVPRQVLFFDEAEIPMTENRTKVQDERLLAVVAERLGR